MPATLHEMRPVRGTEAHKTDGWPSWSAPTPSAPTMPRQRRRPAARGDAPRRLADHGAADAHQVPAGGALAVDRDGFSPRRDRGARSHPLVTIVRGESRRPAAADWDSVIVATGPLTSPALAEAIRELTGEDALAFFDAIAPIVHFDSIDMDVAWFQSRYDKAGPGGTGADYINCPMDKEQYEAFIDALLAGEKTEFKEWEHTPYFDGCLPIEVMAERGRETLRTGR
jgi:methylenetetrahydrofolate--tRNA-(uracil-5-)-methyltransferase